MPPAAAIGTQQFRWDSHGRCRRERQLQRAGRHRWRRQDHDITTTIQISVEAITQRPLVTTSPYRGLDRFEDRDKDLFFGRDQLIKSLLAQFSTSNVLLVLGASGSGKSSVVRAGLLPQLSRLARRAVPLLHFRPGRESVRVTAQRLHSAGFSQSQTRDLADAQPETPARLIHALQREGDQWLFFVDQFEEIFTVADERLRKASLRRCSLSRRTRPARPSSSWPCALIFSTASARSRSSPS